MDVQDFKYFFELCDTCQYYDEQAICEECISITVANIRKPAKYELRKIQKAENE